MEKMKYLYVIAGFSLMLFINGCASIVSGTDQIVTFNSEPDGATVIVAGRPIGRTPLSVQVKRVANQTLAFEKAGYQSFSTQLATTTNGWFWGNILIGGLLGSTTDGASGAIYEYSPDSYFITLVPEGYYGAATSRPGEIRELVIAFGSDIRSELEAGRGDGLDAMLALLNVPASDKPDAINTLKQLAIRNYNDLEFAQSVIDRYGIK